MDRGSSARCSSAADPGLTEIPSLQQAAQRLYAHPRHGRIIRHSKPSKVQASGCLGFLATATSDMPIGGFTRASTALMKGTSVCMRL